ncbi:MAG: GNAT family N-acetyltransferase [Methylococcus sp.]
MRLLLQPATEADYQAFIELSTLNYARDNTLIGNWPAEESLVRAQREMAFLLPEGRHTAGHYFFSITREDGAKVGNIWFGIAKDNPGHGWIYQLHVLEPYRRQGVARTSLDLLAAFGREQGLTRIGLHVFGHNQIAFNCYLGAGYETKRIIMEKDLTTGN